MMKNKIREILQKAVLELQKKENWGDFEMPACNAVATAGRPASNASPARQPNGSHGSGRSDAGWPEIEVDYPKNEVFGDYSTNVAMILGRVLKKNPLEIAEQIISVIASEVKQSLRENGITTVATLPRNDIFFEKIEIAKPGYLNFYLSKEYLQKKVEEINNLGEKYGNSEIGKGTKVNNEFISANPTGPLHLGNGRGGFFGDCLGNILRKTGFDVTNEYYVNDAGEQVIKLVHSFRKDDQAVYSGEYINELREKKPEILEMKVAPSAEYLSEALLDDYIIPAIKKMKVKIDNYTHEKDLYENGYVDKALNILKEKKLSYEADGARWFKSTEFGDDKDRVLIKQDGQKTYLASDCGYILNKIERKFDKLIEIWGADHHGYISRFKAVAEALGFSGDLKFIIVQLVKLVKDGKEVRMSKRAGNVVYIDELLDKINLDVARFFFLMYSPDTHMNFDLGLAEEKSEKNPVYYVQYAHARVCSILQKAESFFSGPTATKLSDSPNLLTHEKELNLIKELNKFPELVEEVAESYEVHRLPYYAIKLADKFHSFYNECRVIDEENFKLTGARLELVKAARIVLAETLRLMGVGAPESM